MEQGGEGYARRIAFEGIKLDAVNNPLIIDQFYCPSRVNCKNDVRPHKFTTVLIHTIEKTSKKYLVGELFSNHWHK